MAVWASAPPQQSDRASATAARDPRFRIVMAPTLARALTAGPASGAVAPEGHDLALGGAARHLQRRPDRPGRDAVDPDALRAELLGQRLHEVHRGRLGLGIVVEVRRGVVGLFRRRRDDGGAGLEVRQRRLDVGGRVDVGLPVASKYSSDRSRIDARDCWRPALLTTVSRLPSWRTGSSTRRRQNAASRSWAGPRPCALPPELGRRPHRRRPPRRANS